MRSFVVVGFFFVLLLLFLFLGGVFVCVCVFGGFLFCFLGGGGFGVVFCVFLGFFPPPSNLYIVWSQTQEMHLNFSGGTSVVWFPTVVASHYGQWTSKKLKILWQYYCMW